MLCYINLCTITVQMVLTKVLHKLCNNDITHYIAKAEYHVQKNILKWLAKIISIHYGDLLGSIFFGSHNNCEKTSNVVSFIIRCHTDY